MYPFFCNSPDEPDRAGRPGEARGRWGWNADFMSGLFSDRPRGRWRGGRLFEQGDLRFVILQLLEEKPRHGYEIIKALEERSGGAYAPSPGTVYPTLQLLEDLGYARVASAPGEEGKKVYEITDAGRAHLAENRQTVDSIFDRMTTLVGHLLDEPMTDVHRAMHRLGKATYSRASQVVQEPAELRRIVEILDRAAGEIAALGRPDAPG